MFLTDLKKQELILIDPVSELEVVFNFEEAPQHRFVAIWAKSTSEPRPIHPSMTPLNAAYRFAVAWYEPYASPFSGM